MASERASQQAFFGVSARLFAVSAAVTIVWCASMSAMGQGCFWSREQPGSDERIRIVHLNFAHRARRGRRAWRW